MIPSQTQNAFSSFFSNAPEIFEPKESNWERADPAANGAFSKVTSFVSGKFQTLKGLPRGGPVLNPINGRK